MRRRRLLSALAIAALFLTMAYASAVVLTHIDHIFLPGNEIAALTVDVPGTDARVAVSVPGLDSDTDADRRLNILVLGLDRRPEADGGPEGPGRSDSIYVVSVDLGTHDARVLGIPRDLWVDVPVGDGAWAPGRINEAYAYGEAASPGRGPAYAAMAVERNLGIPVDHWVVIDWEGFKTIIDALGGVDVLVEEELADPEHPDVLAAFPGGVVTPGLHHMDGEQALGYARTRHSERGDLDRIHRQQQIMLAVLRRAVSVRAPEQALELWRRYSAAVITDVAPWQVPGLALVAGDLREHNVKMFSLGDAVYDWQSPTGALALRADEQEQARIIDAFLGVPVAADPAFAGS
ncbi:MAG TPA: LCP family protein [Dehalococcoidia bacterium]